VCSSDLSDAVGAGAVAASNPGLVYLRTGRKTVASAYSSLNWSKWQKAGIRYVVSTLGREELPPATAGELRFKTSHWGFWIVEIKGPSTPSGE